ncbi:MAG: MFS transporter [bacterium]|nr:MFS transporter [bacterium]MCM1375794.1 MFS transporter [Muribaculum sp.]
MSTQATAKKGLLANAFSSSKWDSRIKSQNTTRKELWLGYVLGIWGMAMTSSIVNSYFNQYLTDVIGFDSSKGAWIASFMVLFPVLSKLIDAVTNLVMAKVIDSTTCRQGKVRPWLLISTPFVFVSVILLFWMPFTQPVHQAIWIMVAFNLYYSVSFTMWNMAKELTAPVSTRNVNQRKNLAVAARIVVNVGTGLVSILFPMILASVCKMVHGNNAQGYLLSMSIMALIGVCTTFVQYFYTRERVTEERRNQSGAAKEGENAGEIHKEEGMWVQLKACLKSKYWILLVIIFLLTEIMTQIRNISLIYYSGWVVNGNAYGNVGAIQAKFQMIALSPMGPGILLMLPLTKKFGRTKTIWTTSILTIIGSITAFLSAGHGTMIYAGTALSAIGNISFSYMMLSFMGDVIDQVEWKTKVRADGITGGFVSAVMMFAVGIAQGIFNLGLMVSGYMQPQQIGMDGDIALYADQAASATNWINMAYQGSYIIIGLLVFFIFCFVFELEKDMPQISKELQERHVAECKARGIEYIPADELERREREEADRMEEEIRVKELREKCAKRGLDFEEENRKALEKIAAKKAKAEAKARKKAGK